MAGIDNEAGMLLRNLRTAHGNTFQAALFNQSGCKVTLRPTEGTAAGREIQRLLIAATLVSVLHAGGDFRFVSRLQAEGGLQDDFSAGLEAAMPIAESAFTAGIFADFAGRKIQKANGDDNIFQFSAISTGIHENPSAY